MLRAGSDQHYGQQNIPARGESSRIILPSAVASNGDGRIFNLHFCQKADFPKWFLPDARTEMHAFQFFSTRQLSPADFSELHTPAAAFLDTKGRGAAGAGAIGATAGARQKPIADHLGRAKPAGHRGWLGRRGNGVVLPLLALASRSGSRGG